MPHCFLTMNLVALPALNDNYIWMLHDGRSAIVVDPGVAEPVATVLHEQELELAAILVTHHHGDHMGGVEALHRRCGNASTLVYLPAADGLSATQFGAVPVSAFRSVQHDDVLQLPCITLRVLDVPGHTAGHIAYMADTRSGQEPLVFCGDTLFSGGCGRVFEGTPAQMHASLSALAALPPDTLVCCAHEYTLSNLRFAQAVEPDNAALLSYIRHCEALRAAGTPTVPSTIGQELAINPFLRVHQPAIRQAAQRRDPALALDDVQVFATLREWKNHF